MIYLWPVLPMVVVRPLCALAGHPSVLRVRLERWHSLCHCGRVDPPRAER